MKRYIKDNIFLCIAAVEVLVASLLLFALGGETLLTVFSENKAAFSISYVLAVIACTWLSAIAHQSAYEANVFKNYYTKLIENTVYFGEMDLYRRHYSCDAWPKIFTKFGRFTKLRKMQIYKGSYSYIWDRYDRLIDDLKYVVKHIHEENIYIDDINSNNIFERFAHGSLYQNKMFEDDIVIMRRWDFFIQHMNDRELRNELADKFIKRFGMRMQFTSIADRFVPNGTDVINTPKSLPAPDTTIVDHLSQNLIDDVEKVL